MEMLYDILRYAGWIILGLFGLGFLIGFHELGHFIFCKIFGVLTPSFSIGMGPKIFKKKIGTTEFSISAIPGGGYVEIAGLEEVGQGEQKEAKRKDHLSFNAKPYYQKLLVMLGGIVFNFLFAYITLVTLFWIGMPKISLLFPGQQQTIIHDIDEGSPAQKAGLQKGDKVVSVLFTKQESIVNQPVSTAEEFTNIIQSHPNTKLAIFAERDGQKVEVSLTPEDMEGKGNIGIKLTGPKEIENLEPQGFFAGLMGGIKATNTLIAKTAISLKNIFNKSGIKNIGGPLMILKEIIRSAQRGMKIFFIFLALISINLAILNLIPLPIFDGGQILFTTIEAIIRRELPEKVKNAIHIACWIFIIALMILLTLWDAKRIFM